MVSFLSVKFPHIRTFHCFQQTHGMPGQLSGIMRLICWPKMLSFRQTKKSFRKLVVSTAVGKESNAICINYGCVLIEIAYHKFENKPKSIDTQQQVAPICSEDSFPDLSPTPCCHQLPISIDPDILSSCPYTAEYVELVLKWAEKVSWPQTPCVDHRYTSLLELYVDCYLTVMQPVPVQLVPKSQRTWGGQMCYALRSNSSSGRKCFT